MQLRATRAVGLAAIVPAVSAPAPPAPVGAPKLSGVKVTQRYPIGTSAKFLAWVAYLDPIGGIGPFLFGVRDPSGKYKMIGDAVCTSEAAIVGPGKDTLTVVVVDGRGDQAEAAFDVAKVEGNGLGLNTRNPLPAFSPLVRGAVRPDIAPVFKPVAYGPLHADTRAEALGVVNADGTPSVQWWAKYGAIWWKAGVPKPGSYPVRLSSTNPGSGDTQTLGEVLVIEPTPPITLIEVMWIGVLSTATVPGTVIGKMCATVPDNGPVFVLTDASGTLMGDSASREIRAVKTPVTTGSMPFKLDVSCGGGALTGSASFAATVVHGEVLDPARMSLALNKLDNSTPGQKVGLLAVSGVTGGTWRITEQSGFNPLAVPGQYGNPARYQVDASGLVYTPPDCVLSYQNPAYGWETDRITALWTSADGTQTCQQTFPVPVSEAPEKLIYVGPGMATAHPGVGYDTFTAAIALCGRFHPGIKYRLKCAAADPDYYTDATRSQRQGIIGPVMIDVADLANPPRGGGKADNTGVNSGTTGGAKGFFLFSHGDAELIGWRVSGVHGSDSSHGLEGVRKDGNTYGNLALVDTSIEDCDQGLECGVIHGYIFGQRMRVRRCGGASVGAGLTHGFYIGGASKFELVDSYVDGTPWGHLIKSRARQTILRRNRIYDTGAAACCVDLPNGGDVLLEENDIRKGPFAANPAIVNFGAEGPIYPVNRLVLNRNILIGGAISYGGNYGPINAVVHYRLPGLAPSSVSGVGNQVWLPPLGVLSTDINDFATAGTTALTDTIVLTVPPPSSPLPAPTTRPYRRRMILDGTQEFRNFNGMDQLPSTLKLGVAAPGPVCTITPVGELLSGPDPFAAGSTAAIVRDGVYNGRSNPDPWAPDGSFAMDGATLMYRGGLKPGGYFVQVRFTAVGGAISDGRYFVTVTA